MIVIPSHRFGRWKEMRSVIKLLLKLKWLETFPGNLNI